MLKIKDNVDLKGLEKFGFEKSYCVDSTIYIKEYKIGTSYKETLIVWAGSRELQIECGIQLLGTVYDLIQAGLVEKI